MEQHGGPSDAELIRRALGAATAQERTAAFEAIAGQYRLVVLRQCAYWFPDPDAAQDVGQAAFTLLTQGKGPERPDKLAGWLIEIARRRGREFIRKTKPADVQWADLPEGRGLDETEDDDEFRSGSAVRRAHATRLVERVVATFTDRQREIYQLRFVQELTGKQIAGQLGIADKAASNEATIVQGLIADGFGALILMQEGRAYCRDLARILDSAATAHAATTRRLLPVRRKRISSLPRYGSGSSTTSTTAASATTAGPATPNAVSSSALTCRRWSRSCSGPISATASTRSSGALSSKRTADTTRPATLTPVRRQPRPLPAD